MSYTTPPLSNARYYRVNNVNPGTITAGSTYEVNVPVPGVLPGDVVVANCTSGVLPGQFVVSAHPAGPVNPNVVYLRITNVAGSNIDPGAFDYNIAVFKVN